MAEMSVLALLLSLLVGGSLLWLGGWWLARHIGDPEAVYEIERRSLNQSDRTPSPPHTRRFRPRQ